MRKSLKDAITTLHRELRGEFTPKGSSLMYTTPTDELIGVTLDGSSHNPAAFYIWVYWLPLYAPTKYLYFNYGKRIRFENKELWSVERLQSPSALDALVDEIMRWKAWCLDRANRLEILNAQFANRSFHAGRALFYLHAKGLEFGDALRVLEAMPVDDNAQQWEVDYLEEMRELSAAFPDPARLAELLRTNVECTKSQLRLH